MSENLAAQRQAYTPVFPGVLASIGWIIGYFVLQLAATAVAMVPMFMSKAGGAKTSVEMQKNMEISAADLGAIAVPMLWALVASGVLTLILMWLYLRKGDRAQTLGLSSWGNWSLGWTVGIGALLMIGAAAFNQLYSTYIIPGIEMQDQINKIIAAIPKTSINVTFGVLVIAVLAPILEEVLFRGLLQTSLSRHMPAAAAIGLSAFLFAVVHGQPYAILPLMLLGAVFGYLYYKTGSLRVNIALHVINNGAALLATALMPH